ncbi:MAG TPA: SRPBCC domain-containing protein, partial [Hyphomicrobiaceae bacterium]|nr:SRPBCC domain-containing protein [Hyphomicrobiaceae bacterium]
PQDGRITGRLEARIGPIAASFAGEGSIRQIAAEHRQIVEGRGSDRRSGSRTTGSVDYRLTAVAGDGGGAATRVDVVIAYTLAGPLAQVGRSALVRDLVRRIGEAFAQNLDARLADPGAALPRARLGGLSLMVQVLVDRLRAWLARLTGGS